MNAMEDYMQDKLATALEWMLGAFVALCIAIPLTDLINEVAK